MALNFGIVLGVPFKGAFLVLNLLSGNYFLAFLNGLMLFGNLTMYALQRKKQYVTARFMMVIGIMIFFTYIPIYFHNSSEYMLLLDMAAILILFDSKAACITLIVLDACCFIFVKASLHFVTPVDEATTVRNIVNLVAFFICLTTILFYYRHQQKIYQAKLEKMNLYLNGKSKGLEDLNRSKEKIFSILSHDLRQPLISVKSLLQLMNRQALSKEAFRDLSANVNQSLDSIILSLDNTLNWSINQLKGIRTRPEPVNLYEIAGNVYELLQENICRKSILFIDNIQVLAKVYADKEQVTIILRNLVSNAIKFTNTGGLIHLSAKEKSTSWELSVEDNGIGMDDEMIRKIFDAEQHFTRLGTANEKGTGLGLRLVKELVERNDGDISVTSLPGKGTTFSLHLKKAVN
ncbi:MAG: HAMP domain-containing sensor histidine kinase [Puia sp.]|nr:HAMP domain-containing sensor histidine kinase [Puia sp.]